jgi:hypothetical protein
MEKHHQNSFCVFSPIGALYPWVGLEILPQHLPPQGEWWFNYSIFLAFKDGQQIFLSLGNDRPKILIQLEKCVIHTIIALSEGKSMKKAMDKLHSQLSSLVNDLCNDDVALAWFNLEKPPLENLSNPPPYEFPSSHSAADSFNFFNPLPNAPGRGVGFLKETFQG